MRIFIISLIFFSYCMSAMEQEFKKEGNQLWYSAVHAIVEKISSPRGQCFTPSECQTESGAVLECHGDQPIAIHTPIGTLKFVSRMRLGDCQRFLETQSYLGDSHDALKDAMIKHKDRTLHSIMKVGNIALPEARFKEKKDFISSANALSQWSDLKKRQPSKR